jgi:hypothetical protein
MFITLGRETRKPRIITAPPPKAPILRGRVVMVICRSVRLRSMLHPYKSRAKASSIQNFNNTGTTWIAKAARRLMSMEGMEDLECTLCLRIFFPFIGSEVLQSFARIRCLGIAMLGF